MLPVTLLRSLHSVNCVAVPPGWKRTGLVGNTRSGGNTLDALHGASAMWRHVALLAVAALLLAPSAARAQEQSAEPTVRRAIESVLEMETGRDAVRLPRITLDAANGDLTVVFAMRRPLADDPSQIVGSGTDDVFTILSAIYSSAAAPRIRTATVIGTYAVGGRYERPREIPLLRAVLSADRSAALDWTTVATVDPREAFDVWWVEGELAAQQ
jgi:hypothetical protein